MATDKKLVIVPAAEFDPATLPFGVVTGDGVDNYDKDGKEYSVSAILGKKEAKALKAEVLEYWEANKGKATADEPANFGNVVREKDGEFKAYFKSKTHFGDKENKISIVDAKRNPLDTTEYGLFGGESKGRVAVLLAIYSGGGKPKGVSMFLSAVQLTEFQELSAGGGAASAFGEEDGEAIAEHGFDDEKPKKKKKKSKK